jgi:hypothetical protein
MRRSLRILCCLLSLIVPGHARAQQELRSGDIVIRYWPGQLQLAQSLVVNPRNTSFAGIPSDIFMRGQPVTVYLAPDEVRFDSLTEGRAPEWGAGVAFPDRSIIVVPGYVSSRAGTHELPQIVRHELAHVALQRHLRHARVPRWFTEGYATWVAGEFDESGGWQLRVALATSAAPPLDSITLDWPRGEIDARLAYLLSASAVRYLHSLGTPEKFALFLRVWAEQGNIESALRTVYIVTPGQLEKLWIAQVKKRYGWLQVIAQSAFGWGLLTIIMAVLFVVRRRRDRKRMARLRQTEPPDQPAYWNELEEDGTMPEPEDDREPPA